MTSFEQYLDLLTPKTDQELEAMAEQAQKLTLKQFGKTMQLYAPIYLSNECDNHCVYCGFAEKIPEKRVTLTVDQVLSEAEVLKQKGFRHVLLVSGEKKEKVTLEYLKEVISRLHQDFESIGLEIQPLSEAGYRELFLAGADSLTVYQEVYDRELYKKYHPRGAKSDYDFRIGAPERAARGGFYKINIGTLLGLGQWQEEAKALGQHAAELKKKFWQAQISVSFPRLTTSAAKFKPQFPVSDREMVQLICALRIYQPTVGLVLSTREKKELRDNLISLGITQMSAESKTAPGGYSGIIEAEEQFSVSDQRTLNEVVSVISAKGYDPVLKDWDRGFIGRLDTQSGTE
ncbi:MAG: 2-iminoacetate synthase ThiH [bacterium]